MPFIVLLARGVLALVFVVAGLSKLADLPGSRAALRGFGVPATLSRPFGVLLPLAELVVGVALLPAVSAWWAALGALALRLLARTMRHALRSDQCGLPRLHQAVL